MYRISLLKTCFLAAREATLIRLIRLPMYCTGRLIDSWYSTSSAPKVMSSGRSTSHLNTSKWPIRCSPYMSLYVRKELGENMELIELKGRNVYRKIPWQCAKHVKSYPLELSAEGTSTSASVVPDCGWRKEHLT